MCCWQGICLVGLYAATPSQERQVLFYLRMQLQLFTSIESEFVDVVGAVPDVLVSPECDCGGS
jgi:hypothetical protein